MGLDQVTRNDGAPSSRTPSDGYSIDITGDTQSSNNHYDHVFDEEENASNSSTSLPSKYKCLCSCFKSKLTRPYRKQINENPEDGDYLDVEIRKGYREQRLSAAFIALTVIILFATIMVVHYYMSPTPIMGEERAPVMTIAETGTVSAADAQSILSADETTTSYTDLVATNENSPLLYPDLRRVLNMHKTKRTF